jgi:hypothetical protein
MRSRNHCLPKLPSRLLCHHCISLHHGIVVVTGIYRPSLCAILEDDIVPVEGLSQGELLIAERGQEQRRSTFDCCSCKYSQSINADELSLGSTPIGKCANDPTTQKLFHERLAMLVNRRTPVGSSAHLSLGGQRLFAFCLSLRFLR